MKFNIFSKLLCLALIISIVSLSTNSISFAATDTKNSSGKKGEFITNEDGEKCLVISSIERKMNYAKVESQETLDITYEFYPIDKESTSISLLSSIGSYEDFTDKNGCFEFRLSVSGDKSTISNVDYLKMTSCTGSSLWIESGAQVSGTSLELKNVGITPQGQPISNEKRTYSNVGTSFTKYPGFSNYVLANGNIDGAVSALYKCSITRGGSTWTFNDSFVCLSN